MAFERGEPVAPAVIAVVVTWNRHALLQEAIAALRAQTHPLAAIVVVDNHSSDTTAAWLANQEGLAVVTLERNTGGAGGFTIGIQHALARQPDLVWLLDDDTIAEPDALAQLLQARTQYHRQQGVWPHVLASRVVWTDGTDHPMNTPRAKPGASRAEKAAAAQVGAVPIRSASFVSLLADAAVISERGLPIADYFLWNDDFEYSTRLIRDGVGLYVPASVVVHKTTTFGATDVDPGDRFFYEVRNKAWMLGRSQSLTVPEKVIYGAATLRRWGRTMRAAKDRRRLWRGLGKGLWAARKRPRSNAEVLRGAQPSAPLGPGQPFSLLMSSWAGDDPDQLELAFTSAVTAQQRQPAEVVWVQDGPVPTSVAHAIKALADTSPVPVQLVKLPDNRGLGPALRAGLAACHYDIVARMDTDDVCTPDRFARQLPIIEAGADIVGSGLWEFGATPQEVVGQRTPPDTAAAIAAAIRFRDPFNHPTVVYRKSAVLAAGNYPELALLEDYLLFIKMVEYGADAANIAEPLVYYRVGDGAYARRGGLPLLRSELRLQRQLRRIGITSRWEYLRNVSIRGGYRLIPEKLRAFAYRRLLANRTGTSTR